MLTIQQAAERLSCSPGYVRKLLARGELPCLKDGRFIRIREEDLAAYMDRHRTVRAKTVDSTVLAPTEKPIRKVPGLHLR